MARQEKVEHVCPKCGGPLKKTIGAASRKKFWECVQGGVQCFRKPVGELSLDISGRWYPR